MKRLLAASLLLLACGSNASSDGAPSGSCPNLAGTWTITAHCVSSFIGQTVTVTQNACSLSFAAPFSGFSGTVAADGKLSVSGPSATGMQECSGNSTVSNLELSCPGPCAVTLAR